MRLTRALFHKPFYVWRQKSKKKIYKRLDLNLLSAQNKLSIMCLNFTLRMHFYQTNATMINKHQVTQKRLLAKVVSQT